VELKSIVKEIDSDNQTVIPIISIETK